MSQVSADPYVNPGASVLRNKAGLRDAAALAEFELTASARRAGELREAPVPGAFDLVHMRKIHRHLFQDVYTWAGELREVNISKGSTAFARSSFIEAEGTRLSAALAGENHLRGLPQEKFVTRLTEHYADWNALHPFREGNGRTMRLFFSDLARSAGHGLDSRVIAADRTKWNDACAMSYHGRLNPLKEIFNRAVASAVEQSRNSARSVAALQPKARELDGR